MDERIKIRVVNPYKGTESQLFGGKRVPMGAEFIVDGRRAREIIAAGNGVPVLGPTETKAPAPGSIAAEGHAAKKDTGATDGKVGQPSSSDQVQASPAKTAKKRSVAPRDKAGKS
jgi:hypothetical protein